MTVLPTSKHTDPRQATMCSCLEMARNAPIHKSFTADNPALLPQKPYSCNCEQSRGTTVPFPNIAQSERLCVPHARTHPRTRTQAPRYAQLSQHRVCRTLLWVPESQLVVATPRPQPAQAARLHTKHPFNATKWQPS
jgi:hypothetical protein